MKMRNGGRLSVFVHAQVGASLAGDVFGDKAEAESREPRVNLESRRACGGLGWCEARVGKSRRNAGLDVVQQSLDSNVVNFERASRELPSAKLSITLPILLIGIEPDEKTATVDVSRCRFAGLKEITGRGMLQNQWRIVNAHLIGMPMERVDAGSDPGLMPTGVEPDEDTQV